MSNIIGISPLQYVHVLDMNSNITRVETGPQTVVLDANERLVAGPLTMIVIPPVHFCMIKNPMSKYVPGKVCELRLGQFDVRFHAEPFCLYPGEELVGAESYGKGSSDYKAAIRAQPVIQADHAIRLTAVLDHTDTDGVKRKAGDIWQIEGPLMYFPTPNAEIVRIVAPDIIRADQAMRLKALQDFTDKTGRKRVTGEEWYVNKPGAYLTGVNEEVVSLEERRTLTLDTGLKLRASQTFTDDNGVKRLAGEQWLLTGEEQDEYYPQIGVEVVSVEKRVVLAQGQYCVVLDPVDTDFKPQLGKRELRKGCCSFFLHPGERLEQGIQNSFVLSEDEAIVLLATEAFKDTTQKGKKVLRKCGEKWMINGPVEYIPPIEVNVIDKRKQIPMSKNEGIYVQDTQTGRVRAVMGPKSYMLQSHELLWKKELDAIVEEMLKHGGGSGSGDIRKIAYFEQSIDPQFLKGRDKTRVVQYRCPGNTAVQVNNYLDKTARVVFGPDLVILGPHENFSVLSLSAGKPKVSNAMKSLCLMLGPDFITDIIEVETSDHARLKLKVAFNNHFEYERGNKESESKVFAVPDFIGFACRQIGSRIRAAVALIPFDEFHRHSAQVIQQAVFRDPITGATNTSLKFDANNLVISSIDIQSIEPVDRKMSDSLTKSIQLAIEISTNSLEAAALHEALRTEQEAKGHLERQKLTNEKESERERCKLLELRSVTAAVESTGQATAEAQAQAERVLIECESEIEAARLKAKALAIEHYAKLEAQNMAKKGELTFVKNQIALELQKEKALANIEVNRFSDMVSALGADTLAAIATAGPDTQVKLLSSLGLESTLITDGNSPINLFMTAQGLVQTQQ
ncbi:major vault protein-like [Mercenaria mercenaria]|uniref:major vault protein-like n=1 Tax=Mercenaria mercenaria TaxID=6596 RepID=UPI00234E69EB|nr:major vault protein-like [Mercenaria mercenaria]